MRPPHTAIATPLFAIFRSARARRPLKMLPIAFAFMSSATVACQALSILNTIDDWSCSPETEQFKIIRTLAVVAGRGRPELDAEFFLTCMEDAATRASPLSSTRINEIAAGCVLISSTVFSETE